MNMFTETEEEVKLIRALEAAIAENIAQGSQPTITETMILQLIDRSMSTIDGKLQVLDRYPK